MRLARPFRRSATAVLAMALASPLATAQVPPPRPLPPGAGGPAGAIDAAAGASGLAAEVRRLADDLAIDLATHPARRHLIEDAGELAEGLDHFARERGRRDDPYLARRAYAGLQASWRHLRDGIVRSRESSPVIDRDMQRIDALDAELGRSLGLATYPYPDPGDDGPMANTVRLARALADRADDLALTVRTESARDPDAGALIGDVDALARESGRWAQRIAERPDRDRAARGLRDVCATSARIDAAMAGRRMSRRMATSWDGFVAVEEMLHGELGLPAHRPTVVLTPAAPPRPRPVASPLPGLAADLQEQIAVYIQAFAPTADDVPEGHKMLADAKYMLAAATAFRQDVERGADPNTLVARFRDVDAPAQRLARRVNRIANGRTGPNIRQVNLIAANCERIHQLLGMPAFPPVYGPR